MNRPAFPLSKQIAYACGMMGWSILINLISVMLVYFYLPPDTSGLPTLITQAAVFGLFNIVPLVMSAGRLADAFYDPFIAQLSDRSLHPKGRRIPFMKKAILPSLVFCVLVFYPLKQHEDHLNLLWLIITLIGFYISTTTYFIPYNALLPELAPGTDDKIRLATWQSVGFVMGIGIASNAFNLASLFQGPSLSYIRAIQLTVLFLSLLAAIFMLIPILAIDEKKYSRSRPSSVPMTLALKQALRNKNFLFFLVADFSYFIAVTIITSGLVYFVTVLLPFKETVGNKLMIMMVLISFVFYPVVNYLAVRIGKKPIVIVSFLLLAVVFAGIYFLGNVAMNPALQIGLLIGLAAIPLASLNILPNAILAEIIEKDSRDTRENKEAIYFAVRYFFVKIAQTLGIGLFTMLLMYGKNTGDDLGIRLNGVFGLVMCVLAALIFAGFREKR